MKRLLLIASHYPPVLGSSGVHRSLKFSRYLLDHDWQATVLTMHPRAHQKINAQQLQDIPQQVEVIRAFALDSARHLAWQGRYLLWTALPDRWVSWILGGIWSGLKAIRQQKIQAIFSTFPLASGHYIAYFLHKLTGLPWIADFRDPMTGPNYPSVASRRAFYLWIERKAAKHASRLLFTTPGALRLHQQRYPQAADKMQLIGNGYDEEDFKDLPEASPHQPGAPWLLLHSGLMYQQERDPRAFFEALSSLQQQQKLPAAGVKIRLRGAENEDYFRQLTRQYGIETLVDFESSIGYRQALSEMMQVDGLLLFQGSVCNNQIPAKVYEYLRCGQPVLALTDPAGDTATVLRDCNIQSLAAMDDPQAIAQALLEFLQQLETQSWPKPDPQQVAHYSRRAASARLAETLDSVLADSNQGVD